jgi:hypothetical protein
MALIKVITPSVTDANITTAKVTDNAITLAKMASGTDGNIISYDASGNPVAIATGSDGQVLTSTGAGSPPAFEAIPAGGKVLQVVMGSSDTQLASTNASDTLLTKAITPTATSSSILCMITLWLGTKTNSNGGIKLLRDSTAIGASSNPYSSTGTFWSSDNFLTDPPSTIDQHTVLPFSWTFLDTGISTTSSTTYSVATDSFSQLYYNRPASGAGNGHGNSTFTLMEIAG